MDLQCTWGAGIATRVKNPLRLTRMAWLVLALFSFAAPFASRADTIVYTFAGFVSGSYNGSSFTSKAFPMEFEGDTANVITNKGVNIIGYSTYFEANGPALDVSLTIADVGSFQVTNSSVYVFSSGTFAGFGKNGMDVIGGGISPTYDLRSSRTASLFGSGSSTFTAGTFSVTGGPAATIGLSSYTGMTFGASAAPVPEPAASAAVAGALFLAGASLRRKRR